RFEFLGAAEQFGAAGAAAVDALGLRVGVLPGEGAFGRGLTQDRVLLGIELAAPFLRAQLDPGRGKGGIGVGTHSSTLIRSARTRRRRPFPPVRGVPDRRESQPWCGLLALASSGAGASARSAGETASGTLFGVFAGSTAGVPSRESGASRIQ